MFSLTQAAKEVGLSRSTIFKAIKMGRLSATKDEQGHFVIDPVELLRVYSVNVHKVNQTQQADIVIEDSETVFLKRENEMLKESINDLKTDRDHWRTQATMLLTYQPETSKVNTVNGVNTVNKVKRGFWKRLLFIK